MKHDPTFDSTLLNPLINAAEKRHDICLSPKDLTFLRVSMARFIEHAVDKFIAGAAEHVDDGGSFVDNVNHNTEAEKEIIDLYFYNQGQQHKAR